MYGTITVDTDQTIVSIVGNKIAKTENVLAKVFESIQIFPCGG